MAKVRMENYDAECRTTAEAGGILVAGFNFGYLRSSLVILRRVIAN